MNKQIPSSLEKVSIEKYWSLAHMYFDRLRKFTDDEDFLQYLKDQNFGLMIISAQPEMDMLAHILGIPRVIRMMGILKAGMNLFSGGAPYYSYEANVYNTNVFGRK